MQRAEHQKWYALARWRRLRTIVLARDPVCCDCKRAASTVADHIKPHRGNLDLFTDLKNLQGLCKPCHDKKTASEDGGFGNTKQQQHAAPMSSFGGQRGTVTSVGSGALDAALDFDVDALLQGV
jgi:5-methylcytosine-specific restriction protein A